MKTSNKLLLLFFGSVLFLILCGIIYFRFFGTTAMESIEGNNQVATTTRDLTGYRKLEVFGNMEVTVSQGDYALSITGESNLHEYVDIETMDDESLHIKMRRGFRLKPNIPLMVHVTAPHWDEINSSGSSKVASKDTLFGEQLKMEVAGAGTVNLLTVYSNYGIEIAGAPQVTMAGTGQHLVLDMAGAAQFKSKHLTLRSARVEAAGASSIWVHTDSLLDVSLVGASNITYSGNPPTINSNLSGACTINKEN